MQPVVTRIIIQVVLIVLSGCYSAFATGNTDSVFYPASHPDIRYTGRVDFTDPSRPRFWAPGTYISIRFSGTYCIIELNDEEKWGKSHNYIQVILDNNVLQRVQTKERKNRIVLVSGLKKGTHNLVICKNTEAEIGYLELVGFTCSKLLHSPEKPKKKIEFIGNSITCGMGNDASAIPCKTGEWYDQHNAYMAYGPVTARALNAQWHLSSVSGIGLIHSCCNKTTVMPEVFDKICMSENKLPWDFTQYQPDLVTVCLGQNDGIQDSSAFCSAYIRFIRQLRAYYPRADFLLLNSPMADSALDKVLRKYLTAIANALSDSGEKKVTTYFFRQQYNKGCDAHPNAQEHLAIANELSGCIKKLLYRK